MVLDIKFDSAEGLWLVHGHDLTTDVSDFMNLEPVLHPEMRTELVGVCEDLTQEVMQRLAAHGVDSLRLQLWDGSGRVYDAVIEEMAHA